MARGASSGKVTKAKNKYVAAPLRYGPSDSQIMTTNLFSDLPSNLPEELFTTLLEADNLRIEKIVSHGHASPEGLWYDQDRHEWVVLLQGAARLSIEGDIKELKPGDFINIAAHQKHRVEWTTQNEPTVWLAVYYGEAKE